VSDQTHTALELIVVDDTSEDDGPERARAWLELHGHRFARALLLRHACNSGLAAARNTAFATAHSPWCFVLDADNLLEPEAVRLCLAIAAASPASTAVVHPLVELRSEGRRPGQPSGALMGRIAWQRSALEEGNQIDAMALVRKEAWRSVGGYSHIPGGWEDYDFWCKLIDAGYHGVLCPQRLAVYHQHQASMQARETLERQRALSRLLRTRHPWLRIAHDLAP
jgi:glycosyltransferase involved in cell wall biosynthesis